MQLLIKMSHYEMKNKTGRMVMTASFISPENYSVFPSAYDKPARVSSGCRA